MKAAQQHALQTALLDWYARHQRDLPWRRTRDPYAIWVSEVLLQQTQVTTAIPYYKRFLARFPSVAALARAPLDDVLKHWEGLGYYARARNLHRAAQQVISEHGGQLPQTVASLKRLPGIGPYTAGAIASIAFGLDEPVLDGNVARVLCRALRIKENPKHSATRKKLWRLARKLIPAGQASVFNQALMDLGATVCTPRRPRCPDCPLQNACGAWRHGEQDVLPRKAKRVKTPHHDLAVGVVWKGATLLLVRRPQGGLLGGLWALPSVAFSKDVPPQEALRRHLADLGLRVQVGAQFATVQHAFTHLRTTQHAFACRYVSGRVKPGDYAACHWVKRGALGDYTLPKATHKVLAALAQP